MHVLRIKNIIMILSGRKAAKYILPIQLMGCLIISIIHKISVTAAGSVFGDIKFTEQNSKGTFSILHGKIN